MPMTLVKLKYRNGRKFRGIKMIENRIFHWFTDRTPWDSSSMESAKRTSNATQAASSSKVNRILVAMRALRPNEMKAKSEKVMMLGSRSMHLARSFAVYDVTKAAARRVSMPHSQPAYLNPIGRLSRPTPIKTLKSVSQPMVSHV